MDDPTGDGIPAGPVVEWISSGVPTELPTPEDEAVDLLGDRGLLLFPDEGAEGVPRSRSRRRIGYVTRDAAVLALASLLAERSDEGPTHPMVLAADWIAAGYSVSAAAGLITSGVSWPSGARTLLASELDPSCSFGKHPIGPRGAG